MRGCLTFVIGLLLGAGLVLLQWPHDPKGVRAPSASDVHVVISDTYLARLVQQRSGSIAFPQVRNVVITSVPPAVVVVRADLLAGPVSTPSSLEVQPIAEGGTIDMRILSSHVAGIPVPPLLTSILQDAINRAARRAITPRVHIVAVRVRPEGVDVYADDAG